MNKNVPILFFTLILLTLQTMGVTIPVSKQTVIDNSDYLVDNWDNLSFKHQRADNQWISNYVNPVLDPKGLNWNDNDENISLKCLSYAASTIADWHSIETGQVLPYYQNILNNKTEFGHNPRELEQVYTDRVSIFDSKYDF